MGIPTASNFAKILTPGGKPSRSAESYMFGLLGERMTGEPQVEFTSHWQDRGSEMEAEAVRYFEFTNDCSTEKVGFISNDTHTIGCSPDRLVEEDALLEIKCPSLPVAVSYLLKKAVDSEYYPQVMGNLWLSERKRIHVMSYYPGLPPALITVERDEAFIKLLSVAVTAFSDTLEQLSLDLQERGWIREWPLAAKPKPMDSMRGTLDALKEAMRQAV